VAMMVTNKYLKFQGKTSNGIDYKWYKQLNGNSKLKKGHYLIKIHDKVMSSCLEVGMMVTNKYTKLQSNTLKGIRKVGAKSIHVTSEHCSFPQKD
jgi:hypothetical protein